METEDIGLDTKRSSRNNTFIQKKKDEGGLGDTTYKVLTTSEYDRTLQAAAKQGVDSFGRAAGKRILEVLIVAAAITALVGTLLYTGKIETVLNGAPVMNDTAIYMMLAGYGTLVLGIAVRACMWGTDKDAIDKKLTTLDDPRSEESLQLSNYVNQHKITHGEEGWKAEPLEKKRRKRN